MSKRKHMIILEELKAQVRSLKKKNNHLVKSANNNHAGLLYWKKRALHLNNGLKVINEWTARNINAIKE